MLELQQPRGDSTLSLDGLHATADSAPTPVTVLQSEPLPLPAGFSEHQVFVSQGEPLTVTVSWLPASAPEAYFVVSLDHCTDRDLALEHARWRARLRVAMERLRDEPTNAHRRLGVSGVLDETPRSMAGLVDSDVVLRARARALLGEETIAQSRWQQLAERTESSTTARALTIGLALAASHRRAGQQAMVRQTLCLTLEKIALACGLFESVKALDEVLAMRSDAAAALLIIGNDLLLSALISDDQAGAERLVAPLELLAASALWPTEHARLLSNLASLAAKQGRWSLALLRFEEALLLAETTDNRPGAAAVLGNIGALHDRAGRYRAARLAFEQALELHRGERDRIGAAQLRCRLGQQAKRLGAEARARRLLEASAEELEQAGVFASASDCRLAVAEVERQRGNLDAAREGYRRAYTLARSSGDTGRAERALTSHFAIAKAPESDRLLTLLTAADTPRDRLLVARARRALGQDDASAVDGAVEAALAVIAPGSIEQVRLRLQHAEWLLNRDRAVDALAALQPVFNRLPALLEEAAPGERPMLLDSLYAAAELGSLVHRRLAAVATPAARQKHLQAALEALDFRSASRSGLPLAANGERFFDPDRQTLTTRLAEAADALFRSQDPAQRRSLTGEVAALRSELLSLPTSFRPSTVPPAEAQIALNPPVLPAEVAVLRFHFSRRGTGVWVLRNGRLSYERLPEHAELAPLVTALRDALRTRAKESGALLARLGTALLGPLASHLDGVESLRIVADGALRAVPFAALRLPDSFGASANQYVLERFRVQLIERWYAPPAAEPERPAEALLVSVETAIEGVPTPRQERPPLLPALAFATAEVDALEARLARYGGKLDAAETQVLQDDTATREALVAALEADPQLLHVAAHGLSHPDYPELSGLYLSAAAPGPRRRSAFFGYADIANLDLSAELVVLSACETAIGRLQRGTGLESLASAFQGAGARWVLASLWAIDDYGAARLIEGFYDRWLGGMPASSALRATQLALLDEPGLRHPTSWAAFQLLEAER